MVSNEVLSMSIFFIKKIENALIIQKQCLYLHRALYRGHFICSTFRERTATSNKEIHEQTITRGVCAYAQTTPLGNRGCRRPVHGNGMSLRFFV